MSLKQLTIYVLLYLLKALGVENNTPNHGELKIMYIVKDDNPAVGYSVSFTATDAEGNQVPSDDLVTMVESTDEDVVAVDEDAKTISFGNPGVATVNVTVEDANGNLLGSFAADFTVTTGDPAAISGGSITFDGLTEAES